MSGGSEESAAVLIANIKKEVIEEEDEVEEEKMDVDEGSGSSTDSGNEEEDNGNSVSVGDYVFIQTIKHEMPSSSEEEVSPKKKTIGGGSPLPPPPPPPSTSEDSPLASPEKKVIRLNPGLSNIFKTPSPKGPVEGTGTGGGGGPSKDNGEVEEGGGGAKGGGGGGGGASSNSEFLKASLALAAALKSEPKKKVFCANTNCNMKTDTVFEASMYGKLYFGMKPSSAIVKICGNCAKKQESYEQQSKGKIVNKENLFDLKTEIQTAESDAMIDLDSPGKFN